MPTLNMLPLTRISDADRASIEAVDPAVRITDASGWFDGEYRDTWPAFSASRYLSPTATGKGTRDERDRNRKDPPLKPAPDAVFLDSTNISLEQALAAAEAIVAKKLGPAKNAS